MRRGGWFLLGVGPMVGGKQGPSLVKIAKALKVVYSRRTTATGSNPLCLSVSPSPPPPSPLLIDSNQAPLRSPRPSPREQSGGQDSG